MTAEESSINPYQPTTETASAEVIAEQAPEPAGLQQVAARWFVVCGISAVPSFFFGFSFTGGRILGMLLGIFLFAVGYTLLDYRTADWPIRKRPTIRRTLRFTYGTRIAISILFPIGMYLDLICGVLSIGIATTVFGDEFSPDGGNSTMTFTSTLVTTLIQGCVLNFVLGVYGLIVLGVHGLVRVLQRSLSNHS